MAKPNGLAGCSNLVNFIIVGICHNNLVDYIGLVDNDNLNKFIGHDDLVDLIGFVNQVDLIVGIGHSAVKWQLNGFNGFIGFVYLIGHNGLISCISLNDHTGCNILVGCIGLIGPIELVKLSFVG